LVLSWHWLHTHYFGKIDNVCQLMMPILFIFFVRLFYLRSAVRCLTHRCSQRNRIHASLFMLCISILCVNCLYVPFSLTKPKLSSRQTNPFCNLIGFFFHYFLLTSFMWMFIMAIIQYMQFVRIFNSHISHFFLKTCCIGWLLPLLCPFLVILIGSNGGYIGDERCWINDRILLYVTFLVPISIIVLCNLLLFVLTLRSIFHRDASITASQNNRSKLQISAAICCFVSIGQLFSCLTNVFVNSCRFLF
jgi:hypothetical protein